MEEKLAEYEERIRALLSSKDKLCSENNDLLLQLEETMQHTFHHVNQLNQENNTLKESGSELSQRIEQLTSKNSGLEHRRKLTCSLLRGYKVYVSYVILRTVWLIGEDSDILHHSCPVLTPRS